MIVQCENCQSTFNLDDTLIQDGGTNVRCSLCKHVFTVYPLEGFFTAFDEKAPDAGKGDKDQEEETSGPDFSGQTDEVGDEDSRLEADLNTVYKDMFQESGPAPTFSDADEKSRDVLSEVAEGEAQSTSRPSVDFPEMEADTEAEEAPPTHKEPMEEKPGKKKRAGRSKVLTVLLVIILMVLAAAAAVVFLRPQWLPPYLSFLKPQVKQSVSDAGVRLLMFKGVSGSFIDSEKAGDLFVIRGEVSSKYRKPRSYILIKGNILDDKGQVIKSELAYAGNTFTDEELKSLPYDEIKRAMKNKDGMARQNFNVPPGTSIPFMIAFRSLPDNLSEFTVEAVSSSPGA